MRHLFETLDLGEAEALTLAVEIEADEVLIDEAEGRKIAERMGLIPLGVLGLLLRAKQQQQVDQLGPLMDKLSQEMRFFISDELRARVLRLAGE